MKIHRDLINQKVIKKFISLFNRASTTRQYSLMDHCHICTLKTKHIRRVVKNLIQMIRQITHFNIRSFKDHTQENPLSKVLNNFLKGNIPKSEATQKCKHHTQLKQKIIDFLLLEEAEIMKRCQIILMSQIKTNYTLDTISLQMRLMPFRFPFGNQSLKLPKRNLFKQNRRDFPQIHKDDADQIAVARKKRKEEQNLLKQLNQASEKDVIKIEATHIEQENWVQKEKWREMEVERERKQIQWREECLVDRRE